VTEIASLKNQKFTTKRLRKHQAIRRKFNESIVSNILLVKNGQKITRKLKPTKTSTRRGNRSTSRFKVSASQNRTTFSSNSSKFTNRVCGGSTTLTNRPFVDVFMNKMNGKFLKYLKNNLNIGMIL